MKNLRYLLILFIICISLFSSCKKPYNPPTIQVDYKFLVIDGALVNSIDSPSVFALSRTIRLTDSTTASFPETGATLSVEGTTGASFPFTEMPGGIYKSIPLVLGSASKYRLKITTSSGEQYLSDFVEVRQTPAIDSISWQQQNDVSISINTHDPLDKTIYYKWDFVETWQYRSQLEGELGEKNGLLYYTDSTNQTYNCWKTANSTDILIGTSAALSQDVISNAPITTITQNTERLGIRYSILVKQYAITEQAYQYLLILKKNTEQLGSIFDAQPTQLIGNIHSVSNPSEVVIGYFTASSVQQERIFIDKSQLAGWNFVITGRACDILYTDQDPNYFFLYHYTDPEFGPYFFSGGSIVLTRRTCLDCTLQGGSNKKPAFW